MRPDGVNKALGNAAFRIARPPCTSSQPACALRRFMLEGARSTKAGGPASMDSLFAREAGEVENAFLSAPFEADGWNIALRLLARRTASSRAQLLGLGDEATLFNFMPDIDPGYQQEFLEIEGWRPEVNWRVAAGGRPLEILSEAHYDAARQHSGTAAYEEHVHRWGGVHGCQTVLVEGEGLLVGLAALRSEREGRTQVRDRKLFAVGASHALAAVRMQQA